MIAGEAQLAGVQRVCPVARSEAHAQHAEGSRPLLRGADQVALQGAARADPLKVAPGPSAFRQLKLVVFRCEKLLNKGREERAKAASKEEEDPCTGWIDRSIPENP